MKLGKSISISDHDVAIRVKQARKFLEKGKRVRIIQRFSGREITHAEIGMDRIQNIVESLRDVSKIVMPPKLNGRQVEVLLTSLKNSSLK